MDLSKLNLTPREQRTLEAMGFDSIEKIAVCWRDQLGLGKAKGDAIISRARNILAYERIRHIKETDDQIRVVLSDTTKPTLWSVEHVLGIYGDLKRAIDGNELVISRPERKPCVVCQREPLYLCRVCEVTLCQDCRPTHEHGYYQLIEISSLEQRFEQVREKAREYRPMPLEKRVVEETRLSDEVIRLARLMGFQGFADTFFSELEGNNLMKQAITCALFSTPKEPVHVLLACSAGWRPGWW